MQFLNQYLKALRLLLPGRYRDDIIEEISSDIRSQVADRQSELGRPLTEEELAAILGAYGHPVQIAARYRAPRQLVSPLVFPYYWMTLKIGTILIAGRHLMAAGFALASAQTAAGFAAIGEALVLDLLLGFGAITLLAALVDWRLSRSRILEKWDPTSALVPAGDGLRSALAALPTPTEIGAMEARPFRGRARSLPGLLVGSAISVWWLAGLKFPTLFFGPGARDLDWGQAMDRLFPVLAIAQLLTLARGWLAYFHADGPRYVRAAQIVWMATGAAFIYFVTSSNHEWLIERGTIAATTAASAFTYRSWTLPDSVNAVFSLIFLAVSAGCLLRLLRTLLRWAGPLSSPPSS